MAFYDFYRQNLPVGGGGLVTPPQPFYQPQPSWGGLDYYRAQAQAADSSLYEYGLERIRGLNFTQGITGIGIGAGIEEAKILHQRAYFVRHCSYDSVHQRLINSHDHVFRER